MGNLFFFNDTATTEIYTLSLHDALPISRRPLVMFFRADEHGVAADPLPKPFHFRMAPRHETHGALEKIGLRETHALLFVARHRMTADEHATVQMPFGCCFDQPF